ncbi:hypothetical protein [Mycoplasmopsis cynos]|uniref:hypothetical protein n=1 Tax=Mycoplasmopsis cynos TaxID=171284 RepID=UPI003A5C7931
MSEKFYLNDKCFSLDLKENINSYFLFNLLKKNEKRIMELEQIRLYQQLPQHL